MDGRGEPGIHDTVRQIVHHPIIGHLSQLKEGQNIVHAQSGEVPAQRRLHVGAGPLDQHRFDLPTPEVRSGHFQRGVPSTPEHQRRLFPDEAALIDEQVQLIQVVDVLCRPAVFHTGCILTERHTFLQPRRMGRPLQRTKNTLQRSSRYVAAYSPMSKGGLPLHRHAYGGSPLRPGTVVVAHVGIAQQFAQDKPGVGRPFPYAAVRYYLLVAAYTLSTIYLAKLIGGLERAVLSYGGCPGYVGRAWDVAAALSAFLGQVLRRKQLSAVFGGRPHVYKLQVG